jgi:hypothetical protein
MEKFKAAFEGGFWGFVLLGARWADAVYMPVH